MSEEQYLKIESWLKSIDSRLDKIESNQPLKPKVLSTESVNQTAGIEKLARFLKSSSSDVYNIISFEEGDKFTLLFNIGGKNETEKQLNATLCLLTVLYYCYDKNEIATNNLKQKLEFLGIKSLNNLSDYLKKHKKFVILKGKARSSKFNYKITQPGLTAGLKILSEQIKKE